MESIIQSMMMINTIFRMNNEQRNQKKMLIRIGPANGKCYCLCVSFRILVMDQKKKMRIMRMIINVMIVYVCVCDTQGSRDDHPDLLQYIFSVLYVKNGDGGKKHTNFGFSFLDNCYL